MNKLFLVFLLGASSMFAYSVSDNGVYSNTNNYNINQSNSNNTHIDNSSFFSNNDFTLFGVSGRDYSRYMGYESILYLSVYVSSTFLGGGEPVKQKAVGFQLGVYEELYLLLEYGTYNHAEDPYEGEDVAVTGNFINYGLSWHLDLSTDTMFSIDFIQRSMKDVEFSPQIYDYGTLKQNGHYEDTIVMFNMMFFRANRHSGLEFGTYFGDHGMGFKIGLKGRFF